MSETPAKQNSSAREVAEQLRIELEVYIIRHSTGLVLNEPALYHIQQALEAYAASQVQEERDRLQREVAAILMLAVVDDDPDEGLEFFIPAESEPLGPYSFEKSICKYLAYHLKCEADEKAQAISAERERLAQQAEELYANSFDAETPSWDSVAAWLRSQG